MGIKQVKQRHACKIDEHGHPIVFMNTQPSLPYNPKPALVHIIHDFASLWRQSNVVETLVIDRLHYLARAKDLTSNLLFYYQTSLSLFEGCPEFCIINSSSTWIERARWKNQRSSRIRTRPPEGKCFFQGSYLMIHL